MDQQDIAIIGCGIVGGALALLFPECAVIDPFRWPEPVGPEGVRDGWLDGRNQWHTIEAPGERPYRVAFVCVPTPMGEDGSCDTSIVEQAIRENDAEVFVIKSTVPPGTTRRLSEVTQKVCVFSPEFTGATQHSQAIDDGFVILGGPREWTEPVAELYKEVKPATFRIFKTTEDTAELVKYAENAFLAMKVTFFNEFYRLGLAAGVDFDEFREALLLDPRIGREHSFVYRSHPYWKSVCFDKDLPAIVAWALQHDVEAPLVEAVIKTNELHRGLA